MNLWQILQIEPTKNKKEIKKAYAKLVKLYHPEEDPETFQLIRQAYEQALEYASSTPVEEELQDEINDDQPFKTDPVYVEQSEEIETNTRRVNPIHIEQEDTGLEETPPPPIPINEELFQDDSEIIKNNRDMAKYQGYVVENAVSRLNQKYIRADVFESFFNDSIVLSLCSNEASKNELETKLLEKRYIDNEQNMQKMIDLAKENGLYRLAQRICDTQEALEKQASALPNEKRRKILSIVFYAACGVLSSIFASLVLGNNEPPKQENPVVQMPEIEQEFDEEALEKIEDISADLNKPYLNGYTFSKDTDTYVLLDSDKNKIIESIDRIQYTVSSVLILHNNEGFISYDTSTAIKSKLDYEDVNVVVDKENTDYYLAVLRRGVWYLSDLKGNLIQVIEGEYNETRYIEFIDGMPSFLN